ncbi:DUF2214 family protein [Salinadaptatus halalkaliphilus]|uniref:DUF2214 family protein n=1 Tax=Salinadaptatus halalkaliphilus TaxID=2419781 RepID=A0A4S3TKU9_9EURY|nr:CopD family protein [Salinadaptatus halalkaliphilus]THE64741.1 DUF2214 family protein [Salinadaptatus halalkaliphilus]
MVGSQYFVVRTLHLLGVGTVLGGASVLWVAFRTDDVSVRLLSWFEGLFWPIFALVVFTGLGNLVAFGTPPAGTDRGTVLTVKFGCILAVAMGSVVRTFAVVRTQQCDCIPASNPRLRWLYAGTAWLLGGLVVVARVIVRG